MRPIELVNCVRRKTLCLLTGSIKSGISCMDSVDRKCIKKVLIVRPNHRLGNQLLISPLIQEVHRMFPDSKIDLFVKGPLCRMLFHNDEAVDDIMTLPRKHFNDFFCYIAGWYKVRSKKYDLVINVVSTSSSGRIATKVARSTYKIFGDEADVNVLINLPYKKHIAVKPIYNLRTYFSALGYDEMTKELPLLKIQLSDAELLAGKEVLRKYIADDKKETIALFTFATGAKCYQQEWWQQFLQELKQRFDNYNIIEILPAENVSQIGFSIPAYYSKDLREIASVLANVRLFIGADSGMMHLAVAAGVTTVGLFSITKMDVYAPYGNLNKGIDTTRVTMDQLMDEINASLPQLN